jgi:hypothetical protein
VTFLRQENLRAELRSFLHRHSFSAEQTAFIESRESVNVTAGKTSNRDALWTPKALNYVGTADSMLFAICAEQGIHYEPPRALAA